MKKDNIETKVQDQDEPAPEDDDAMNKTRVEKMADKSVLEDIKNKGNLPELDFKLLVMGKH